VRNHEVRGADHEVPAEKDVQVQGTGPATDLSCPVPAEVGLDPLKPGEHAGWLQRALRLSHRVQIQRLIFDVERTRFIDAGEARGGAE
jgi:hypothetical protein